MTRRIILVPLGRAILPFMRPLPTFVLGPLLLLLTACASETSRPAETGQPTGTSQPVETSRPAETSQPAPPAPPPEKIDKPARPDLGVVVLRDVRAAGQGGFDRVVFEFEGSDVPGYRIGYVEQAIQCGSGDAVELDGTAWLQVQLTPAQAHTEAGEPTVRERERRLDLPVLRELESTCDFEADVTWVLGLASRKVFRVQEFASPARLVVDLEH